MQKDKKKLIGNAEEDEEFLGHKPKAWLYIYRVKPQITTAKITNYIKEKLSMEETGDEVIVKELTSYNTSNKCFMIGAPFDHKNDLYQQNFWPSGVGYRQFDFRRYSQYRSEQEQEKKLDFKKIRQIGTTSLEYRVH
ncbi:hypothetical protein JTB14_036916 [Gonioctena quinquepunctata]|nr:hypothetical protein JTB14_036916 [Gonioctena quinquepunctata]